MKASGLCKWLFSITILGVVVVLLRQWYIDICHFPSIFPEINIYESFGISDWLINYQGGFVRRGLAGELFFQLYQCHPYSVIYAIIFIDAVSLIILGILLVWLFRRMGLPIWLLLFPMFLFYSLNGMSGLLYARRDSLMLLLAIILFSRFRKFLVSNNTMDLFVIWGLTVIILLLYEGIFFSLFPFLVFYTILSYRKLGTTLLLWWPMIFLLFFIAFFHGNESTPQVIWYSWMPCFENYPVGSTPSLGTGVDGLHITLSEAIKMHFTISWLSEFSLGLPVWPFNLYLLIAIYFLMTRSVRMSKTILSYKIDGVQISNILILQLLFTLPMLGLIADDWYRLIPYCCITTCFLCYLFPDRNCMPIVLDRFSEKIQQKINKSAWLSNPWLYYFVLVSLPLCQHNARPGGMFPFIPSELKHWLLGVVVGT